MESGTSSGDVDMTRETWILRAVAGKWPISGVDGKAASAASLPLSPRLLSAIDDWQSFFDEIEGDLSLTEVAEEFVGQGFKIAHAMRRELKGRLIYFAQPVTGELLKIG